MKNVADFLTKVAVYSLKLQKKTGQDKTDLASFFGDTKSGNLTALGVMKQKPMSIKCLLNAKFSTH